MIPPAHPGWQVDSEVKDMEWFYMFREKFINSDLLILHILVMSWNKPKIKDEIPVLGLDFVERSF